MKTYTGAEQRNIMEHVAAAFVALRDGSNRVTDFNTLANAFNVGIVLAEGIGQGAVDVFSHAMQALLRADQVYTSMKAYFFTQADLVDIAKGVAGYAELLRETPEKKVTDAIAEAERRLAVGILARVPGSTH